MTREEFIQQLLLAPTDSMDIMKEKLSFYDKEVGYYAEIKDILNFINRSKNFKAYTLVTPYGEFAIAIDTKSVRNVQEWLWNNTKKYGVGIGDVIKNGF